MTLFAGHALACRRGERLVFRGLDFALDMGGQPFPIIWSIVGSALFVAVIALIARRPRGM